MSRSSEFNNAAGQARDIYEVIGESGATYIFFWFSDDSVTAARRKAADTSQVAATYVFGQNTKAALDDCGMADFEGTTYQKGRELLKRLRGSA
jgi:hypothetical protein